MTITFTDPAINYYVEDVEVAVRFYTKLVSWNCTRCTKSCIAQLEPMLSPELQHTIHDILARTNASAAGIDSEDVL